MLAEGDGNSLGAVGGTDFRVEPVYVFFHALAADSKLLGYLWIAQPAGQRMKNVRLTGRQLGGGRVFLDEMPYFRGYGQFADRDVSDGCHELRVFGVLCDDSPE